MFFPPIQLLALKKVLYLQYLHWYTYPSSHIDIFVKKKCIMLSMSFYLTKLKPNASYVCPSCSIGLQFWKNIFFTFKLHISPFWISFLECFKSVLDRSAGFMGLVLCSKHNIWLFSLPPFQTSLHKWFKNRLLWCKSCFTMFKLKGTFNK